MTPGLPSCKGKRGGKKFPQRTQDPRKRKEKGSSVFPTPRRNPKRIEANCRKRGKKFKAKRGRKQLLEGDRGGENQPIHPRMGKKGPTPSKRGERERKKKKQKRIVRKQMELPSFR